MTDSAGESPEQLKPKARTIALIHPPACDPTAPYIAVPALAGFLRAHGRRVVPIDANVEAFDALLSAAGMTQVRDLLEQRIEHLDQTAELPHADAVSYAALWRGRGDARHAVMAVDDAKAVLRDRERFFDASAYGRAVEAIECALRAVSAAYHPTFVDFMTYRTPFGLTSDSELAASARPEASPFDDYLTDELIPRLAKEGAEVIGLSVCFPGQVHVAYVFALRLKQAFPHVHLTVGGPCITQLLARLSGQPLREALGPFDSAVLFEGEHTLLRMLEALESQQPLTGIANVVCREGEHGASWTRGEGPEDLKALPPPDFDGMPLDRYFSPLAVLPYDPTRGCYWGRCAFCHYGLAERGTAAYRERTVPAMTADLAALSARHGVKHFYLSHDSVAPKTIVALAQALAEQFMGLRWATDLKPEPYLTQERAWVLRRGGAVACALGVESAANRVLNLIGKGHPIETVASVMRNLTQAGIAVEAMCFTDFPTETGDEALQTLRFLRRERASVAGFIVGEFGITHGSRVAQEPSSFGIDETWTLAGDRLGLSLLFAPRKPWKTPEQRERIDAEVARLSSDWALRPYPWAGAVSTAHTILYYDRFGPGVFRELARVSPVSEASGPRTHDALASFDMDAVSAAEEREAQVWATLVFDKRVVGRSAYEGLAGKLPAIGRAPRRYAFRAGEEPWPARVTPAGRKGSKRRRRH